MSNQCETFQALIVDYALRELDSRQTRLVEEHIQSCPACSEALGEAQRIVSALSDHEMVEPSPALCDSVRETVHEEVFGRRKPFAEAAVLVTSFVRRPLLVGASALILIAAVTFFLVLPALRPPVVKHRGPTPIVEFGTTLRKFQDYLTESRELMKLLQGAKGPELLVSHDWKGWVAQAMAMQKMKGFEAYRPLLRDMEKLYREIEACNGTFGQEQILQIREFISGKNLTRRMGKALSSAR